MDSWLNDLGDFISRNAFWAGPVLGLITLGESMVLIGAFFPATALMLVAGGLAAAGVVNIFEVIAWCVAGAFLGDAVSYWLGRKLGPRAWRHPILKGQRRIASRSRLFFRKYGVLSIYLCRFMGPVRAFVPLIAGITTMPHLRFQLANFGSALIWVPVMLAPGYLAGVGVTLLGESEHALEWIGGGIAVFVLTYVALRAFLKSRKARLAEARH